MNQFRPKYRRGPVTILPYNKYWTRDFEKIRNRIKPVLAGYASEIEHIGSTAVPGLGAKPIIDIMVAMHIFPPTEAMIHKLEGTGMIHMRDLGDRFRVFFHYTGRPEVHLHLVPAHTWTWRKHILFRDALREDENLAVEYEALKRKLAEQFSNQRQKYTDGKADFICQVIENAAKKKNIEMPEELV